MEQGKKSFSVDPIENGFLVTIGSEKIFCKDREAVQKLVDKILQEPVSLREKLPDSKSIVE